MTDATELARARAALANIVSVCRENAGASCRHDLALKFVEQLAAGAMVVTPDATDILPSSRKPCGFTAPRSYSVGEPE